MCILLCYYRFKFDHSHDIDQHAPDLDERAQMEGAAAKQGDAYTFLPTLYGIRARKARPEGALPARSAAP